MKLLSQLIKLLLPVWAVLYLAFSFYALSLDPAKWMEANRGAYGFICMGWAALVLFSGLVRGQMEEEK